MEKEVLMKRIIMLVTAALVMAAMVAASAMPAFAGASRFRGTGSIDGQAAQCQRILTPSANVNIKCSVKKPEDGNEGGSGGGGATVVDVPFNTSFGVLEGHLVQTPSGNDSIQGHAHP
jgi:hypothetical protein